MEKLSIDKIQGSTKRFFAHKMENTETLWINDSLRKKYPKILQNNLDFASRFSFGIIDNHLFDTIIFNKTKKVSLCAEYYGVGGNAGGVRCGNLKEFQIKGIGRNNLYGEHTDLWHSYGGLSLLEAVCEVINSTVLSKILPIGTIECLGLIYTGKKTAYTPNFNGDEYIRGKGAIIVREKSLRPAHFMPPINYEVPSELKGCLEVSSKIYRLRVSNRFLSNIFLKVDDFIIFFSKFLQNCANQFSFSRLFRIAHSALTSSNISFDGKWLDLTGSTFLPSGKNYQVPNMPSFYDEESAIISISNEFIYNYSKYSGCYLDNSILIDYYKNQLRAYKKLHCLRVFGFNINEAKFLSSFEDIDFILEILLNEINRDRSVCDKPPLGKNIDSNLLLIIDSFFLKKKGLQINSKHKIYETGLKLLNISYLKFGKLTSYKNYCIKKYIKSLRQIIYSPAFFKGNITNKILELYESPELFWCQDLINNYSSAADWIFSECDRSFVPIFLSKKIKCYYCTERSSIFFNGSIVNTIESIHRSHVEEKYSLEIGGYNFYKEFIYVFSKVSSINNDRQIQIKY
ncbi:hypothetical protein [Agarilytica rhodophyticola]|uniref:hypothetical protein n=1 Tax=Agarilytica rhodophyticola TaxID=1737490 RepID=UPI000CD7EBCC|nr:hypothetical protein [Agarilytica rhodophyticola]